MATDEQKMTRDEMSTALDRYASAYMAQDLDATVAALHPDAVYRNMATGEEAHGAGGVRDYFAVRFGAIPDWTIHRHARYQTDSHVIVEGTLSGVHRGLLYGAPPTGRDVHLREMLFYSFRDGKIGEIREHYDQQSLLIDLGVLENTIGRVAVPTPGVMFFTPADDPTTLEEMKAIQLIHRDAEFEQRFDDLIATVHPDACWEDVPTGSLRRGIDGVSRHYAAYFKTFPGWSLQRRYFHDAGRHLLSELFLIVQHDGPWYEVPPSHREVRLPLAVVFFFKEGKVLGEREYYDRLTWRRLLGAD